MTDYARRLQQAEAQSEALKHTFKVILTGDYSGPVTCTCGWRSRAPAWDGEAEALKEQHWRDLGLLREPAATTTQPNPTPEAP